MRILHTESSVNWGGQEYRTLEQMRWLGGHGHHAVLAARPGSEVLRRAEEGGLNVIALPFKGHYSPGAIVRARLAVHRHRIDVVDCHGSRDASTFVFVRDICPVVRTRHITQPLKSKWHRRLLWRHGCDHVITTARFVRDGLIASRLSTPDRITVVGEWTTGDFFDTGGRALHRTSVRDEFRIDAGRPIVSVIGMLRDDKGQDLFIRVIAEMRNRGRRITGLVVGSATQPDYERTLREMVADLDVGDDIVFTGYRDDVARLTQASDVLTIPSYLEAQSRTAPQAFACGTPVVAHRVGGVPELVGHGETGWLVDVGDVAAFADALCRVLDGTEEVNQVTARARRMAEENLQMDTKMAETLAVYEKVIEMRDKTG